MISYDIIPIIYYKTLKMPQKINLLCILCKQNYSIGKSVKLHTYKSSSKLLNDHNTISKSDICNNQ